jgi:hypothetical protein
MNLTIYTCCNGKYKEFIPIFILSSLYFNKDAFIEIGVDSIMDIDKYTSNSLNLISNNYSNFIIREVDFSNKKINGKEYKPCANIIRFIEEPITKNEYVYISDVDIISLEDVSKFHIEDMKSSGLGYSNIVRPKNDNSGWRRMTGLHFTKWENYYPIGDIEIYAKKGMLNHDEVFLYEFVKSKNRIDYEKTMRPVHGIHVSPNRDPAGWGIEKWKKKWIKFRNSKDFLELESISSDNMKEIFKKIDNYNARTPLS